MNNIRTAFLTNAAEQASLTLAESAKYDAMAPFTAHSAQVRAPSFRRDPQPWRDFDGSRSSTCKSHAHACGADPRKGPTIDSRVQRAEIVVNAQAISGRSEMIEVDRRLLLSKLTFGPNARDLEDVSRIGTDRWVDEQLHPTA